jgi:hypothetical protein
MHCLAGKVYNLAQLPMSKSLVATADAERLKRNIIYNPHP